ncbi:MAG: hypothetical protein ACRDO2_11220, partial [Nocardioidaceae bacterium]
DLLVVRVVAVLERVEGQRAHQARAVVAAVEADVSGPFNLAGDGVIDRAVLDGLFGARTIEVPFGAARAALATGFRAHLAPVPAELFDALMQLPTMDTSRARAELRWRPDHTASDAVESLRDGAAQRAGSTLPPLHP